MLKTVRIQQKRGRSRVCPQGRAPVFTAASLTVGEAPRSSPGPPANHSNRGTEEHPVPVRVSADAISLLCIHVKLEQKLV